VSEENGSAVLVVEDLGFSLGGKTILDGVTGAYQGGKIHGIVGPNGSGKSTLLRNLCRIWEPKRGRVLVGGEDQRDLGRRALSRTMTLVPQSTQVDFSIPVWDFVAMGRHPHLRRLQWLRRRDMEVIEAALQATGTDEFRDRPVNELSGGETQLVSIARALATEAPIVLLDEPTSALDIRHKLGVMDLLLGMRAEGKTILLSIHDLDIARRYCDTVTLLQRGRVFFAGSAEEAFARERVREVFGVGVEEIETVHGVSLVFYP